jgi:hypothetical protein
VYQSRNLECSKRLLRELYVEVESVQVNEECDSDGSSSSESEEEKIIIQESDKIKKAIEEVQVGPVEEGAGNTGVGQSQTQESVEGGQNQVGRASK